MNVRLSGQVPVPVSGVPYGVAARLMIVLSDAADTAVVIVPCALPTSQYSVDGVVSPIVTPAKE